MYDEEYEAWGDFLDSLEIKKYYGGIGAGGDPYLHKHYDPKIGVVSLNVSLRKETPQEIIDMIPTWFRGLPVAVHICETENGFREVKRRIYTGETIDWNIEDYL